MFRYDRTQNATSPRVASVLIGGEPVGIAAGEVVGLNSAGAPVKYGSTAVGAPLGVAQADAAIGELVEYATGNVAILFPAGASPGEYAQITAAGVVSAAAAPTEDIRLGIVLTECEAGGRAVVAWDVDYVDGGE